MFESSCFFRCSLSISVNVSKINNFSYIFSPFFVCLYNYEFGLSLCKIVRSSVILLSQYFFNYHQFLRKMPAFFIKKVSARLFSKLVNIESIPKLKCICKPKQS
jgi:hypothetical protein